MALWVTDVLHLEEGTTGFDVTKLIAVLVAVAAASSWLGGSGQQVLRRYAGKRGQPAVERLFRLPAFYDGVEELRFTTIDDSPAIWSARVMIGYTPDDRETLTALRRARGAIATEATRWFRGGRYAELAPHRYEWIERELLTIVNDILVPVEVAAVCMCKMSIIP